MLLILAAWAGCKGPKVVADDPQQSPENPLTLILSDLYGGAEQEELMVIRDNKELAACFAKINMTRKPGLPVPEIDFNKQVALLYSPGRMQDTIMPELVMKGEGEGKLILGVKPADTVREKRSVSAVVTPFILYTVPAGHEYIGLEGRP